MRVFLLCDGSASSETAARFFLLLNYPKSTQVTLFGIGQTVQNPSVSRTHFNKIRSILDQSFTQIDEVVIGGGVWDQLHNVISDPSIDLVVYGERPAYSALRHLRLSAPLSSKLERNLDKPLLVVRNLPSEALERVLVCTSGDQAAIPMLKKSAQLLSWAHPEITVLHVMSQVAFNITGSAQDLLDTAETAMQRGTREGLHLKAAMEILETSGAFQKIVPRLRHGLVLDEVLAEIRTQRTHLLVIGSHFRVQRGRFARILTADIARDLLGEVSCSVLIVS